MFMKKIIAYVGTRKGESSNTYKLVREILDKCKEKSKNIEFEIITSDDLFIKSCTGCEECFTSGICSLDDIDELGKLKVKLLSADMVIFASPIYAHNLSGDMKIFIDRIAYWLHTMKFNGKYAAVISTNVSNGHLNVINYLEKMMYFLGAKTLFKLNCEVNNMDEFNNEEWLYKKTNELSKKIIIALDSPIISNSTLENVFETMKSRYERMKEVDNIIDNFRESVEIGLCTSKTYQEFLDTYYNKDKIKN